MKILITGGAGFIGSNFVQYWCENHPLDEVVVLDALTYAGNLANLNSVRNRINFIHGDIADVELVEKIMQGVDTVVHFAAETHVDRSIHNPYVFTKSNVLGTHVLLEAARKNNIKRFHHISTDEVFGEIPLDAHWKFDESTNYQPNSPYSASKAGSDHLVRSYFHTFDLPITISNCSNNFGPFHHPEKFIPRSITRLMKGQNIRIYTPGNQVRDWLHVQDHCRAIEAILQHGKLGETYTIGGMTTEISNLEVAQMIVRFMGLSDDRIEMVTDRPGHDAKYAVDWSKIKSELGWQPQHDFPVWLEKTITWYQNNRAWWEPLAQESEQFYQNKGEAILSPNTVTTINTAVNQNEVKMVGNPVNLPHQLSSQPFSPSSVKKPMDYIIETNIPGVLLVERPAFKDDRGFFRETFRNKDLEEKYGQLIQFVQSNHSHSTKDTLRGIHIAPWHKLVTVTKGLVQQVIVDARPHSPTFGKYVSIMLGSENPRSVFIPAGCGNSFLVLSDETDYVYLASDYWAPGKELNLAYNDPSIGVNWASANPILSEKDRQNPSLKELYPTNKF